MRLRDLPSVDQLARGIDDPLAVDVARSLLDRAREQVHAGIDPGDLAGRLREELTAARAPRLRRVLNATGVIAHTNLGRAPLAEHALERVREVARGYSNLEYDLSAGGRGSRQAHVGGIIPRLTGAEGALVVNNNAAAVMLALAALAEGREVLVSRGELIEIGDGFRIPDVLTRSGARLREVGTTNRTRAADYEQAIGPETALLLRVHRSNFRAVGFTDQPTVAQLAAVARRHELPLAALEGTLTLDFDAPERIPVLRMLRDDGVRERAERLASLVGGTVEATVARVGGGALPLAELPSFACAVEEELAAPLRTGEPPVIGVVRDGRLLLDCRTLTDGDVDEVAGAVAAARA